MEIGRAPGGSARRVAVVLACACIGFAALTPLALQSDNPRADLIPLAAVGCLVAALGSLVRAHSARRPQWHPDPLGEHLYRYWDGTSWTGQVRDELPRETRGLPHT